MVERGVNFIKCYRFQNQMEDVRLWEERKRKLSLEGYKCVHEHKTNNNKQSLKDRKQGLHFKSRMPLLIAT